MCSTSILGLFMDIWTLWVQWWLNSLQQWLYSTSTCWAGLPCACIVQLYVQSGSAAFLCPLHLHVWFLDLGNHLTAAKPSCKAICFLRKMWYFTYNMENPILYRVPKPSIGRWILKVFGLGIINPCHVYYDPMQLLVSHVMPVMTTAKLLLKTRTKFCSYLNWTLQLLI